jgi:large subunit ribosomal protein L10
MPKAKNISVVADLKPKVEGAKSIVVTDYRGLTHKQSEDLHHAVKKVAGEYLVVKNSLLKISSDNIETTGPTAILLAYEDEISPLKELAKFSKTTGIPKLKFGFIAGTRFDETQLTTISKLPTKDILLTTLLYALNGNLNKLVYVLSQIKPEVRN